MKCSKCGNQLGKNSSYCAKCGEQITKKHIKPLYIFAIFAVLAFGITTAIYGYCEYTKIALYNEAETLFQNKQYIEAKMLYEKVNDYKDSEHKIYDCLDLECTELANSGNEKEAKVVYNEILSILNKKDKEDYSFKYAKLLYENEFYNEALSILEGLEDYPGVDDESDNCYIKLAENSLKNQDYEEALICYEKVKNIDCKNSISECYNNIAKEYYEQKEYEKAIEIIEKAESATVDVELVNACNYEIAVSYYKKEDYHNAMINFEKCIGYSDADEYLKSCIMIIKYDKLDKNESDITDPNEIEEFLEEVWYNQWYGENDNIFDISFSAKEGKQYGIKKVQAIGDVLGVSYYYLDKPDEIINDTLSYECYEIYGNVFQVEENGKIYYNIPKSARDEIVKLQDEYDQIKEQQQAIYEAVYKHSKSEFQNRRMNSLGASGLYKIYAYPNISSVNCSNNGDYYTVVYDVEESDVFGNIFFAISPIYGSSVCSISVVATYYYTGSDLNLVEFNYYVK